MKNNLLLRLTSSIQIVSAQNKSRGLGERGVLGDPPQQMGQQVDEAAAHSAVIERSGDVCSTDSWFPRPVASCSRFRGRQTTEGQSPDEPLTLTASGLFQTVSRLKVFSSDD